MAYAVGFQGPESQEEIGHADFPIPCKFLSGLEDICLRIRRNLVDRCEQSTFYSSGDFHDKLHRMCGLSCGFLNFSENFVRGNKKVDLSFVEKFT